MNLVTSLSNLFNFFSVMSINKNRINMEYKKQILLYEQIDPNESLIHIEHNFLYSLNEQHF
jgi:hypothetical protein